MTERDFQINGKNYKLNKIDAMSQFHIVRMISPIMGDLMPAMKNVTKVTSSEEMSESEKFNAIAEIGAPILNGISKLSKKDSEYVLFGLLASVEMQQEHGNWARMASEAGLLFQNIELPVMLQAAGRAFAYNMSGFFAANLQVSHGGK